MSSQHAFRLLALAATRPTQCWLRSFSRTTASTSKVVVPPRPEVDEADIEEAFLKGSGPGGQKIVSAL